jgi:hypothetical protein
MIQLLARRAAESNVFSVPDRNALWSRTEDDLLMQTVTKYSTSDVLGRDWREVASELPGRSKKQWKERYSLADTVVELSFVFIRTIVHLMGPHPLPLPPCPQSPLSRMYTGTSVLETQPGRRCLPLRN